jgi:hypothetical protein
VIGPGLRDTVLAPAVAGAEIVKLLKTMFEPMETVAARTVLITATLLYVIPEAFSEIADVAERLNVEVPASNVRATEVEKVNGNVLLSVIVLALRKIC